MGLQFNQHGCYLPGWRISTQQEVARFLPSSPSDSPEIPFGVPNPVYREFERVRHFYGLATRNGAV
jgi:hypothetical protein